MYSDINNSLYSPSNKGTTIEVNKKHITIINQSLFIYEIGDKKIKIHTYFENITKNVIKFDISNNIISNEDNAYVILENNTIYLKKEKVMENENLEELKSLLEEYKEETQSLKTFVSSKLNGRQKTQSQNQFPKR